MSCVYILSNNHMPNLLKIGYSHGSAVERATDLSRHTGVPSPFVVEYEEICDMAYEIEQDVHDALFYCRVAPSREFFCIELQTAIDTIKKIRGIIDPSLLRSAQRINDTMPVHEVDSLMAELDAAKLHKLTGAIRRARTGVRGGSDRPVFDNTRSGGCA